jgi:signal transduction histidine kinase
MRPSPGSPNAELPELSEAEALDELRIRLEEEHAARVSAEQKLESQGRALQRIQSQLRDLARESRNVGRARLDFLDILQHELRTPLHGILGTASVLLYEDLNESQREMVELVEHFGGRLAQVVQDLLEFSRLEAGALELSQESFDPAAVARGALDAIREEVDEKGLELELELHGKLPPRVEADERHLAQVLHLLLGNALKFTEHGSIRLSVSWDVDGSTLAYEIRDTGVGIPADRIGAIFEPYEQADPTMTRRFGGAGLGLAIAQHLAEILDGEIRVESEEGIGSSFVLRLPVVETPPVENEKGLPEEAPVEAI